MQDGELVYVDWMPQKDQDSGKLQSKIFEVWCKTCKFGVHIDMGESIFGKQDGLNLIIEAPPPQHP